MVSRASSPDPSDPHLDFIQLVSPNQELHSAVALPQVGHPFLDFRVRSLLSEAPQVDSHGHGLNVDKPIVELNTFGHCFETENTMHRLSEMSHVIVSLESDEVGAEHAAEEMLSGCKASELE